MRILANIDHNLVKTQFALAARVRIWQRTIGELNDSDATLMNLSGAKKVESVKNTPGACGQAQGRLALLALACFIAGAAVAALWLKHSAGPGPNAGNQDGDGGPVALSEATLGVLQRLSGTVEIRFYNLLDRSTVPDATASFAGRVDRLLSAYESAGNGKLKVSRINSTAYSNVNDAVADGMKEFNSDKSPCFLGLLVSCAGQKETLASLAPEWEAALEGDVTRAIARVAEAGAGLQPAVFVARNSATLDAVKVSITNLDSISLEEGTRLLHESALNELAQVTREMETRRQDAQQRFAAAVTNQSRSGQEAARDELQRLQVEQTAKLQEIAAKSQQQVQAWQTYKNVQR